MKTKHIFVPALDVSELLPFTKRKTKKLSESLKEQERARKELEKFVDKLEKNYKEKIWYMGMDVITGKTYERFIFDKGGFFEIMIEAPLAMNAHFVHERQAKKFNEALKKTLKQIMPKTSVSDLFINSIEVGSEEEESLTYKTWANIKEIRNR
ncbi:hypothetical protein HYX18_02555 [Candidatus Woesearchaeota archaeon]|nr:hypothetical protein [Candidatus Woesearchaeota archaeon]